MADTRIDRAAYKAARAALDALEVKREVIAKPFREGMAKALAPTDHAYDAAVAHLDEVTDGLDPMGKCVTCGEVLFDEDPHGYLGDDLYTCADHAPTLSEAVASWEDALRYDPDECWLERFDSREELDCWLAKAKAEMAEIGDRPIIYGQKPTATPAGADHA